MYLNDDMIREVKSFGLRSLGVISGDLAVSTPSALSIATATSKIGPSSDIDNRPLDPAAVLADKEVWIGVMACSPKGPAEGEEMAWASFRDFAVREGTRNVG